MSDIKYDVIERYKIDRHNYEQFAFEVKRILVESFKEEKVRVHTIESRAKTVESFERKCKKQKDDGSLKYNDPGKEIFDLSGVRAIVYTLDDVNRVCSAVESVFDIVEKTNVGEERVDQGKFGYRSIHFLIKLPEDRVKFLDARRYSGMICEIQVRTILQHAWAEIEHDIQYKSRIDLPRSIERKFISLSGLLEIADREFQAIHHEDAALKESVVSAFKEELTISPISSDASADEGEININAKINVRSLIKYGRYDEAINIYNKKIEESPYMYTLYLGRAKSYFLAGDIKSALDDIDHASRLNPSDDQSNRLRAMIKEGKSLNNNIPSNNNFSEINEAQNKANAYLEDAKGVEAYENYSLAQSLGASRPFMIFNKALSCVVAGDLEGAKDHLSDLEIRHGTPMSINIKALECIVDNNSVSKESNFEILRAMMADMPDFNFSLSPIRRLKIASDKVQLPNKEEIDRVMSILEKSTN